MKKAIALLLFFVSFSMFSQKIYVDNVESQQQKFNAKVVVDSINFTQFDIKIKANSKFITLANINNINRKFIEEGKLMVNVNDSVAHISFKGIKEI